MNKVASKPVVPAELMPLWDDHAQEAHERLAATSAERFIKYMPDSHFRGGQFVRYVDMPPVDDNGKVVDHDHKKVVAVRLPFVNGYMPHMGIRVRAMQNLSPIPLRYVILPDNTSDEIAYVLTKEQQAEAAKGNSTALARKESHTLEALGAEEVHRADYSYAAMVGAKFIRINLEDPFFGAFALGSSGSFETPNAVDRSVFGLERDFFSTKSSDFNNDIKGSAIPALEEALGTGGLIKTARQSAGIVKSWAYSWLDSTSRHNKLGMATDTYVDDIAAIRNHLIDAPNLLIAGGSESAIFPVEVQRQLGALTIEGFKHTMGDNVVLHALLARKAIFGR